MNPEKNVFCFCEKTIVIRYLNQGELLKKNEIFL